MNTKKPNENENKQLTKYRENTINLINIYNFC